jgi:hypothetical protein
MWPVFNEQPRDAGRERSFRQRLLQQDSLQQAIRSKA